MDIRRHLSLDRIIFVITGLIGFIIGLLDFLEIIDWPHERYSKIILIGVGLLMVSVVAEAIKRERTLEQVADRFGGPAPKYLDMDAEVPGELERSVREVTQYIHEAVLTWTVENNQHLRDKYRNERDKRLLNREIVLRQVVVIHHKQHFEEILNMLARFKEHDRYEVRYYEPAAQPMPALSLWSFDDEKVYMGSFHVGLSPRADKMLYVYDEQLNQWLIEYWEALWNKAEVLKEGLHLYEAKLIQIKSRLGISDEKYEQLLSNADIAAKHGTWQNGKLVMHS
jgi:hypothetical protein